MRRTRLKPAPIAGLGRRDVFTTASALGKHVIGHWSLYKRRWTYIRSVAIASLGKINGVRVRGMGGRQRTTLFMATEETSKKQQRSEQRRQGKGKRR